MKTAILAVYFGSRDTASMDRLEAAFALEFPGYPVFRAFLNRRFSEVPSVPEALQQLQVFDRVLVQAMLVSDGPSYRQLTKLCPAGAPLLASPDACIAAMEQWLPKPLVLMGHGAAGTDLRQFADRLPADVYFAALEGHPSLEELLPKLVGRSVHLAPFLLTEGVHTDRDLDIWQNRLEAAGCTVTLHRETLAHYPEISSIFAAHLRNTLF